MNTLDIFVEKGKKMGVEIGCQEGMTQKEYEKNLAFTNSLLKETTFDNAKIAQLVGVTEDHIASVEKGEKNRF